jgi:hypothetical protein
MTRIKQIFVAAAIAAAAFIGLSRDAKAQTYYDGHESYQHDAVHDSLEGNHAVDHNVREYEHDMVHLDGYHEGTYEHDGWHAAAQQENEAQHRRDAYRHEAYHQQPRYPRYTVPGHGYRAPRRYIAPRAYLPRTWGTNWQVNFRWP